MGAYPGAGKPESVHVTTFPEERGEWASERLAAEWERLLEVRGEVSRARSRARKAERIGKGIDAVLYVVSAPEEEWLPLLVARARHFSPPSFNVSGVRLREAPSGSGRHCYESADIPGSVLAVVPAQALGWKKCERCWLWSPRVGEDREHPRSASAARRWCARSARWGSSPRSRP